MKKIVICLIVLFSVISVYALTNEFVIDTKKISVTEGAYKNALENEFASEYKLNYEVKSSIDSKLEEKIINLAKKTTYLLVGYPNNIDESNADFYKRKNDYYGLRYNPKVPAGDGLLGFDENSQEYKDDLLSGLTLPSIFSQVAELKVVYSKIGNIRVYPSGDAIVSAVTLPNITIRNTKRDDQVDYEIQKTNMIIYYMFKELDGEYKLYYLMADLDEDISNYLDSTSDNEKKGSLSIASSYNSTLTSVYDYSKLKAITKKELNKIYEDNKDIVVHLTSHYNNYIKDNASGMFIKEGVVLTSYSFIEKSLRESQYIIVKDNNGNIYDVDGLVTINAMNDIAVIKLKDNNTNKINLGNSNDKKVEDPVFSLGSKTGVGLTINSGIVIATDGLITTSIPITSNDVGTPLFDKNGNVIGMITGKQVNSITSYSIGSDALKEIQDKFKNVKFSEIKSVSFEEIKEKFYYGKLNEEVVKNSISNSKWNTYKKIGDIGNAITLNLVKASYKNGIVSLRYENKINNYMDSMSFAYTFMNNLEADGYKHVVSSPLKNTYENEKYQVIIMEEFNYLIVVMVKK